MFPFTTLNCWIELAENNENSITRDARKTMPNKGIIQLNLKEDLPSATPADSDQEDLDEIPGMDVNEITIGNRTQYSTLGQVASILFGILFGLFFAILSKYLAL